MRNSRNNRLVCSLILSEYCKFLELKDIPKLIFYKKDILKLPYQDRKGGSNHKKMDGCYYSDSNVIYININNHRTRKALQDTIIHELVHKVTNCALPHGEIFDNIIEIIENIYTMSSIV